MLSGIVGAVKLPVDDVLDEVIAALREKGNAVVVAPPGAGKTTRVPPALLAGGLARDGDIAVLQPRRLAARMAAERVAGERGESVGRSIGYEVRFDRKLSAETRIRFVTEGVLVRQLMSDPEIARTAVVVLDEFHERHLSGDLDLALLHRLQRTSRPDLAIVVMSATLDSAPVAHFLGDCAVVESRGRTHPLQIDHADDRRGRDELPLDKQVSRALRTLLGDGLDGHVLVFLPGAAEIRRAMSSCAAIAERADIELLALHGDLPAGEQDRAVAPSKSRKVIMATNVAETSITIDGVVAVIDSGLARVARHSPWSGIPSLHTEPISQASATQRAGRAGRTGPGRVIRLYHEHDYRTRRPFDPPEIERADLAGAALALHASGVARLEEFHWFEAPPPRAMVAAERLLADLGAVDGRRALTEIGRRMLRFPVHPRQARILVEAEERGVAAEGCTLAALIGQKELRTVRRTRLERGREPPASVSGPSDLLEDLDHYESAIAGGDRARRGGPGRQQLRALGLEPSVFHAVEKSRRKLARQCRQVTPAKPADARGIEEALLIATLTGYPDRVARRRRPGSPEVVFAGGGSATLAGDSVVIEAELVVAVEVEERGRGGGKSARIRRASAVDPAWLFDLYIERIRDSDELCFNHKKQRVERLSRIYYDDLVIDETRDPAGARSDPEAAAVLADAAIEAGIERFVDREALDAWRTRLRFAAAIAPEIPVADDEQMSAFLRDMCVGLTSFDELSRTSLLDGFRLQLSGEQRSLLEFIAPTHIRLPGRRRVPVHYESDRPPWVASRLQDFFGLEQGPKVGGGRVPLVLHLLAPNQRAVQVTTDLSGFWSRHYPALRRQLMRRYPKHAWPEDPTTASPRKGR